MIWEDNEQILGVSTEIMKIACRSAV